MKKVVVQISGGIESTVMLADALAQFGKENVWAISFNDRSVIHLQKEIFAIKRVITDYGMQQRYFYCDIPQSDFLDSPIDKDYPDVGFIPGLKMFMNIASLAYAQKVGAEEVWIGNMADNVYPDESDSHLRETAEIYAKTYCPSSPILLVTPYKLWDKGRVIRHGTELGVALEHTVSCGEEKLPGGFNCGKCQWCILRKEGFKEANLADPTFYILKKQG
jgi:7-cyano-7-deazaguanine synthase